jgi:hypothetical protein
MSGPTKDEAPTVASGQGFQEGTRNGSPNCHGARHAGQALRVIEGQQKADAYLARLEAQQADPDELAVIVSMLYGAALRGFCRSLEKAIGVRHE